MNILIINYEYPPFGAGGGNASLFLSKALIDLGHEVSVMTASYKTWRGYSHEDNIHVYRIPSTRKLIDRSDVKEMISFVLTAYWSVGSIIKARRIERAIIFFSIPCGIIGPFLRRLYGIPYIISLRGADVPGYDRELDTIHKVIAPMRRIVLRKALSVVANSHGLAALSREADPYPVQVVPNGIDSDLFRPKSITAPDKGNFRILFVGRFHSQKNLVFLLDQFAEARRKTTRRLVLHMVGDGPLKQTLLDHAQKIGLSEYIVWTGWSSKQQLTAIYQDADCCVNPSLCEGMPNALLEAMASGLPIVASDVSGNNELVIHGETGFLFDLQNPSDFQSALLTLIENPQKAQVLGKNGRDLVVHRYSWKAVAQRYSQLL